MRAALTVLLLAAASPAIAGTPLALAEGQVTTLEFARSVTRVATTDPDLLQVKVTGTRVRIEAARAGRCSLELTFPDGATVGYDVVVEPARRLASATHAAASEMVLSLGEERRFRFPGVSRALYEENGVARVLVEGETVSVVALAQGRSSLVLVDGAGTKTTWQIQVR
jgi:hypothetical protein